MKSIQKGFTLIELMIVVAIVGILASLAVPLYQDYSIRAKASEASELISAAKLAVAEQAAAGTLLGATNNNQTGADNMNLALQTDINGEYVYQVNVTGTTASEAIITVLFRTGFTKSSGTMPGTGTSTGLSSNAIAWKGTVNKGSITWEIDKTRTTVPLKYVPKS